MSTFFKPALQGLYIFLCQIGTFSAMKI